MLQMVSELKQHHSGLFGLNMKLGSMKMLRLTNFFCGCMAIMDKGRFIWVVLYRRKCVSNSFIQPKWFITNSYGNVYKFDYRNMRGLNYGSWIDSIWFIYLFECTTKIKTLHLQIQINIQITRFPKHTSTSLPRDCDFFLCSTSPLKSNSRI